MRARPLLLAAVLALSATPVLAQDRTQTLADIRQELSFLYVELQTLGRELNTTGAASGLGAGGSGLARLDALEAEIRRLTGLTEQLQITVDSVVRDGTNRIGDLEFRLCELEPDCDISTLGDTPSLGGVDIQQGGAVTLPPAGGTGGTGGGSLAVAEQSDFDRARAAYDAGDYAQAATLFAAFTETYPGGSMSAEAHFLRGDAEAQQGALNRAARAFLDSFTIDPDGPRAPAALTALGASLGQLGQIGEACLTLAEVGTRYPTSSAVQAADAERLRLGCQ